MWSKQKEKQVAFEGAVELLQDAPTQTITPAYTQGALEKYNKNILKDWQNSSIQCLENMKDAPQLMVLLNERGLNNPNKIKAFMGQESQGLLIFCLIFRSDVAHLDFVSKYVPQNLLQESLRKDDYYSLRTLLNGNSEMDREGKLNKDRQVQLIEKIKILLKIDPDGLKGFTDRSFFKALFSSTVKNCFNLAAESIGSNNIITTKGI